MPIILKNKDGVLLKTAGKYCPEDITVVPQLQEKTVTPSETQQTATPDANYAGLSKVIIGAVQTKEVTVTPAQGQQVLEVTDNKYYKKVTVEAIPPDYVIPSGTIQITENGVVDVSGKANANVNVPTGVDTNDATAVSGDILQGKTAYAKGVKLTGSVLTYDGAFVGNTHTITATLTNVIAASGNATTIAVGETKVLTYTAADGYALPDTVTVTGATGVWDKNAGTLTLSNPTGNVTFTIAGVEAAVTKYNVEVLNVGGSDTIGNVYDNGTKIGEGDGNYQIISGHKISIDVADNGTISSISTSGGVASDGTVTGDGSYMVEFTCLTGDMLITLADGGQKRIDEITLDDKILSYNPETMRLEEDTITYCDSDEVKTDNKYDVWTFSDGTIVKTVHRHRFYNVERQAMTYMDEWKIGEHAINIDGAEIELVSHKVVKENVRHFTIFTENQNYFVNGLLSGNRHTKKMNLPK